MKKQFLKYIFLLLTILTFTRFNASAQAITVEAKLQQFTIRIGEQTRLFLSVHQPVSAKVSFPKLADTIVSKLQVVSVNKPDTAFDQNDKSQATVTQAYLITSFDAGTYTIPSYTIGTVKTNELTLQVVSVKVDTTKAIYDIKQPMAVTYTFWDWLKDNWYWIVIPLVVIAGVIALIVYLRKRPKAEPVVQEVKPNIPPHVIALNKLNELRDKKLWQQDATKEYYIELSDIVREYLEKRYIIKTYEKTTDEILTALKHMSIATGNRESLKQLLVLSDLVKFAKEKPMPAENEHNLNSAIDFVMNTQQADRPQQPEGGAADA